MEARAKLLGHPIHQMLIPFPLGLLGASAVFDVVHIASGAPKFAEVAYWLIVAGIVGGIVAAPFGTADWTKIPRGTRAKQVGALHGIGNVLVILLFAGSWGLRTDDPTAPGVLARVLAFAGVALALATGWLGGELVARLGVGIDDGAHLDAPSSISGRPAAAARDGQARSARG